MTGLVRHPEEGEREDNLQLALMEDDKPYSALGYSHGPSYNYHRRENGNEEGNQAPRKDLNFDIRLGWYFCHLQALFEAIADPSMFLNAHTLISST